MFGKAYAFNQDISNWDVMAVTDNGFMFGSERGDEPPLREENSPCTATGVGADGTTPWRICRPDLADLADSADSADSADLADLADLADRTWRPVDRAALKAAVDSCLAADPTGADCRHDGIPISDWDVSRVTSMNGLFSEAKEFNADIS